MRSAIDGEEGGWILGVLERGWEDKLSWVGEGFGPTRGEMREAGRSVILELSELCTYSERVGR